MAGFIMSYMRKKVWVWHNGGHIYLQGDNSEREREREGGREERERREGERGERERRERERERERERAIHTNTIKQILSKYTKALAAQYSAVV